MERLYFTADEEMRRAIEAHREAMSDGPLAEQSRVQAITNLVSLGLLKAAEGRGNRAKARKGS